MVVPPIRTTAGRVVSVNVAVPRETVWQGRLVRSAIWKAPAAGRVRIRGVNVAGDDQADRGRHGGKLKAVYAYALEDIAWWEGELGRPLGPGSFGENLTLEGVDLGQARVGERWRVGTATLAVTQPRYPCFKLGMRHGDPGLPDRFWAAVRAGAYFSIVAEGDVAAGDPVSRTAPAPSGAPALADAFRAHRATKA